jgi:uncharacterized protein YegP (UPF0339 family)
VRRRRHRAGRVAWSGGAQCAPRRDDGQHTHTHEKGAVPLAGVYELKHNDKGEYSFVLKAANGQVVLRSQQYASRATAMAGIASVQTNSGSAERYEKLDASDGRCYFNLKAANQQVVGTSQMYTTTSARDDGIASVMSNGPGATTTEPTA